LLLAQRRGLRICEIPVTWVEDPDSKVDIVRTALADLRGMARLRFGTGRQPRSSPADLAPELTAPEQHR